MLRQMMPMLEGASSALAAAAAFFLRAFCGANTSMSSTRLACGAVAALPEHASMKGRMTLSSESLTASKEARIRSSDRICFGSTSPVSMPRLHSAASRARSVIAKVALSFSSSSSVDPRFLRLECGHGRLFGECPAPS